MKRVVFFLFIFSLVVASFVWPHKPILGKAKVYLKQADLLATAIVKNVKKTEKKCSIITTIVLFAVRPVVGMFKKGSEVRYSYYDFVWRKGCPSVHYRYAPRAKGMKKGSRIIVSLKYDSRNRLYRVTSSYSTARRKDVTALFRQLKK